MGSTGISLLNMGIPCHIMVSKHSSYYNILYKKINQECKQLVNSVSFVLFMLRVYGPVNPMGSCRARSVYLTTSLLGRLSPLSG